MILDFIKVIFNAIFQLHQQLLLGPSAAVHLPLQNPLLTLADANSLLHQAALKQQQTLVNLPLAAVAAAQQQQEIAAKRF